MLELNEKNGSLVATVDEDGIVIADTQDALDLMSAARALDCEKLIIPKENICREFFDLKTGLAGEILQKYTNYGVKAAIVGDFSNIQSKALRDFIFESNNGSQVFFVATKEAALERLHGISK